MQSASLVDGPALDLLSLFADALTSAEVDVGGREIVQALVVAPVIVVLDEVGDGAFEITWQIVVLEQGEEDWKTIR